MKQKIKEALKQGYKNLGLGEEALERVATSVETLVSEDTDLAAFVKNKAVEALMKFEQADADRKRSEKKKGEGAEQKPQPASSAEQKPSEQPDLAKTIAEAVAAAIKPINDEIAKFRGEQSAKAALETAKSKFFGNDYVKKYDGEASDAWDVAMELYKYNADWTAEQIGEAAMGRFNKAVAKKGVDTTKPFESDGGGAGKGEDNKAFADEIRKALGISADK